MLYFKDVFYLYGENYNCTWQLEFSYDCCFLVLMSKIYAPNSTVR